MNKLELEKRLADEGLLTIFDTDDSQKVYIDGNKLIKNGVRQNAINVFGVYNDSTGFIAFVTDCERGLPNYIEPFDTEHGACDALYSRITLVNSIYHIRKARDEA